MASKDFEQKLSVIFEGADTFTKSLKSINAELTTFANTLTKFTSQMNSVATSMDSVGNKMDAAITKAFFGKRNGKGGGFGSGSIAEFLHQELGSITKALAGFNIDTKLNEITAKMNEASNKVSSATRNVKDAVTGASKTTSGRTRTKKTVNRSKEAKDQLMAMFAETSWIYGVEPSVIDSVWKELDMKHKALLGKELKKDKSSIVNSFLRKVLSDAKKSNTESLGIADNLKRDISKQSKINRLMKSMISGVDITDEKSVEEFRQRMEKESIESLDKQLAKLNVDKLINEAKNKIKKKKEQINLMLDKGIFTNNEAGQWKRAMFLSMVDNNRGASFGTQKSFLDGLMNDIKIAASQLEKEQSAFASAQTKLASVKKAFEKSVQDKNLTLFGAFYNPERNAINNIADKIRKQVFTDVNAEIKAYEAAYEEADKLAYAAKLRKKRRDYKPTKEELDPFFFGNSNKLLLGMSPSTLPVLRAKMAVIAKQQQQQASRLLLGTTAMVARTSPNVGGSRGISIDPNNISDAIIVNSGLGQSSFGNFVNRVRTAVGNRINAIRTAVNNAWNTAGNVMNTPLNQLFGGNGQAQPNPYIPQLSTQLSTLASNIGLVFNNATLMDSIFGTISTGFQNLSGILSKIIMSITAVAAAFVGIGYAMKSFLTDVILSTEKMRGYNIGLLGMMKTQGAVNDLMAKSLNVTKDLPIAYDQIFASTKAFSMISPLRPMLTDSSKAEGNLERLYGIVMALSQIEPEWGIQGAIFSLREALSGDLLSLKRRFEIPVNMITTMDGQKLADVKNNPEMVIGALSDYFSKIYGKDALEATSRQFGSLMAKIQGYWEIFKNNIGEGGIYKVITDDLMKVRDSFGEFASSNGGKAFAKKISDVYITMYESLKNMATGIKGIMDSIFGTNIQGTDSIKLIVGFVEKYAQILRGIAAYLNSPEAKKAFGDLFDSMTAGAGKLYEELKNLVRNISWVLDNIVSAGTTVYSYIKKFSGNIEGIFTKDQQMQGLIIGWIFGFGNVKDLLTSSFKVLLGAVQGFGTAIAAVAEGVGFKTFAAQLATITASSGGTILAIATITAGILGWAKALNYANAMSPKGWFASLLGYDEKGKLENWEKMADTVIADLDRMKNYFKDQPGFYKYKGLKLTRTDLQSQEAYKKWYDDPKNNTAIKDLEARVASLKKSGIEIKETIQEFDASGYRPGGPSPFKTISTDMDSMKSHALEAIGAFKQVNPALAAEEYNQVAKELDDLSKNSILDTMLEFPTTMTTAFAKATSSVKDLTVNMVELRENIDQFKSIYENHPIDLVNIDDKTVKAIYGIEEFFKKSIGEIPITSGFRSGDDGDHGAGKAFDLKAKVLDQNAIQKFYDVAYLKELAAVAKKNNITKIFFENAIGNKVFDEAKMESTLKEVNDGIFKLYKAGAKNKKGEYIATGPNIHFSTNSIIKDAEEEMSDAVGSVRNVINGLWNITTGGFVKIDESMVTPVKAYYDPKTIMAEYKAKTDQIERDVKFATFDFQSAIENNRKAFITNFVRSDTDKMLMEMNNMDTKFGTDEVKDIENKYASAISSLKDKNPMVWYQNALTQAIYKQLGDSITDKGPILKDKTIPELEEYAKDTKLFIENPTNALIAQRKEMAKSIETQIANLSTMKNIEVEKATTRFTNVMKSKLSGKSNFFFPNIQEDLDVAITTAALNEAKDFVRVSGQYPLTQQSTIVNSLNDMIEASISGTGLSKSIDTFREISNNSQNYSDGILSMANATIESLPAINSWLTLIGNIIGIDTSKLEEVSKVVSNFITGSVNKDTLKEARDTAKNTLKAATTTSSIINERKGLFEFNKSVADFKKNLTDKSISQLKAMKNEMAGLNREAKGAWFSAMQGRLEMEPQALGDSFALGIEKAVSEWKNFSEIMMEEGANLVNSMTSAFETGFFDFMTMKIKTLGDLFKQIGTTIRDEILKIIAKMLALQTMKIVLGIDVNAQGQSSFTGGGLLGGLFKSFVPSLFNNKANTTGNSTPYIAGDMMSNFISGGKGNNAVVSSMLAAGGMPIGASGAGGSFLSSGVSNLASGAIFNMGSKALTGTKLFGATGTLTKAWNGLAGRGGFLATNPWVLPAAAAISFLSQPGRLFGGTKDKTGAAQAAYSTANEEREAYIKRRIDDASGYNMSSRFGDIAKYEFGGISYRTWKSGDGWFKGPKEKHAASDATAFYDSMKQYYQLLNSAAKEHYDTTRHINKLKETNELASLQLEKSVKVRYYNQIKDIYNTALEENDKETIDKFRDKFYESANEIADIADAIAENLHNTAVSEARYRNALAGNSDIGSKQIDINEQQYKLSKLTRGTLEWYDAQTEYINSSRELASMLRNQIESAKKAYNSSYLAIYSNKNLAYGTSGYYTYGNATSKVNPYLTDMGLTDSAKLAKYGTTSSKYAVDINYGLKAANGVYGYSSMTGTQTVSYDDYMKLSNNGLIGLVSTTGGSYKDAILDEIIGETFANGVIYSGKITATPKIETFYNETIEEINTRIEELITHANNEVNVMGLKNEYKYRMENLFTNEFDKTWDQYLLIFKQRDQLEVTFRNRFSNYTDPASQLKGADLELYDALKEAIANVNLEIANIYEDVASQIDSWINSGFVGSSIKNVLTTMPLELMESYFKNIDDFVKKQQYKLDAFSTLKDLDSVDFSNVLNSIKNMSGIGYTTNAYGIQSPTAIGALYTDMLGSLSTSGDPWQAWYNFQMNTVKTKITNLEAGTDEWYSAQMELLNLQMEQQQHIKEKTQDVNDAWLDMLESIDKTLQMRIAEERNTAKGDTVFIDMRNINNEEAKNIANQIRDLIAKNDPNAATLIEALKKKLLGIMK